MNRRSGAIFAALTLCAAIPAGQASAQYVLPSSRGTAPAIIYDDTLPPGYTLEGDASDDRGLIGRRRAAPNQRGRAQPRLPGNPEPDSRSADTALPPPGFAVPNDNLEPGTAGHQLGRVGQPYDIVRPPAPIGGAPTVGGRGPATTSTLPPEDQPEVGEPKELPPELKKQMVDFPTKEPAGTLIVDTDHTFLYLVLGGGKAVRYGIGVGREGFTWTGTERVSKMAEWPDWHPPSEMIERQPYLPRFMAGGPGNPLGARALYLGRTLYRIHGTNQPSTIGSYVSSGCIRLLNNDIEDLYSRVQVGSRVVVLPSTKTAAAPPTDLSAPTTASAISSSPLPPPPKR